jgi:hypothetical protein
MWRTGCRNITYAPESGSAATLAHIQKQVKLPRMLQSIRAAKRAGLSVKCNLVIGFPAERHRDVWQTLRLALKLAVLGVDDCGLYLFSPYPGSRFYRELRERGVIPEMSDAYFASLACFMDLIGVQRCCTGVSPKALGIYRTLGMALFYGVSFLLRPGRLWRLVRNVRQERSTTILEQRLCDIRKRRRSGVASVPMEGAQVR